MSGCNRLGKAIVYLALATFIVGGTTLRPLSLSDGKAVQSELQVGDEVRVSRKDGSAVTYDIDSVTDEGISGDGTQVAWSDMQQIEVRQYNGAKTFLLVGSLAVVLYFAAVYDPSTATVFTKRSVPPIERCTVIAV